MAKTLKECRRLARWQFATAAYDEWDLDARFGDLADRLPRRQLIEILARRWYAEGQRGEAS